MVNLKGCPYVHAVGAFVHHAHYWLGSHAPPLRGGGPGEGTAAATGGSLAVTAAPALGLSYIQQVERAYLSFALLVSCGVGWRQVGATFAHPPW